MEQSASPALPRAVLLWLSLAFAMAVPLAIATHNAAHYATARALGFQARLYWCVCQVSCTRVEDSRDFHQPADTSAAGWAAAKKAYWTPARMAPIQKRRAIIHAAGPALTMLCGSVGLALLWRRQRRQRGESTRVWKNPDWAWLVLAMFWARQPVMALIVGIRAATGSHVYIPDTDDEWMVASNLGWPSWSLLAVMATLGLVACGAVLFWLLPRAWLGRVLMAGALGTALGLWLWLFVAGPVVMS